MTSVLRHRPAAFFAAGSVALAVGLLTGCGHGTASIKPGSYPVATAPPNVFATPVAEVGRYQLVSAGDPVLVKGLPSTVSASDALVDVRGPNTPPYLLKPGAPPIERTAGTLDVDITATSAPVTVDPSSFLALDQKQDQFSLTPSAASVTATPGHPAHLVLSGTFGSGHTTLTWQPAGKPRVTWDFVIELD